MPKGRAPRKATTKSTPAKKPAAARARPVSATLGTATKSAPRARPASPARARKASATRSSTRTAAKPAGPASRAPAAAPVPRAPSTPPIPPSDDTLPQGAGPPERLAMVEGHGDLHAAMPAARSGGMAAGAASTSQARRVESDEGPPETVARLTQLDWNDTPREPLLDGLEQRWTRRGEELLRRLTEHGVAQHEYRADLRDGRFVWVDEAGRVTAEADAQVVCSWSRSTSVVAMGWRDPLLRAASIPRIEGMPGERDDVDEEQAWRLAMEAAEACGAEYLYRVPTPHAWYFLALRALTFMPARGSFHPVAPVAMVLRNLSDTRQAIQSRAEPAAVVRERLKGTGNALLHQAEYAYRETDWVARLTRSGKRLLHLAGLIPRSSYGSIAAGRPADEWLDRELQGELTSAVHLLEDEWHAFA
ncbi:MAG: DUF6882 domain-containing protein [Polyangiaceae bacterium]